MRYPVTIFDVSSYEPCPSPKVTTVTGKPVSSSRALIITSLRIAFCGKEVPPMFCAFTGVFACTAAA